MYRQKRAPQVLCCIHISCLPVAIKLENRNKFQAGLIRIILRGLFPESQTYGQSKPQLQVTVTTASGIALALNAAV